MSLTQLLALLVFAVNAGAQSVSPVAFTESYHSISAFSASGTVPLQASLMQIDLRYGEGRDERRNLVVVYDPGSGHYFWRCSMADAEAQDRTTFLDELEQGREAVYVGPSALVDFFANSRLYVKSHSVKASSMAGAEHASLLEVEKSLPSKGRIEFHADAMEIGLFRILGFAFACPEYGDPKFSPMCGFRVKSISSITQDGERWKVVLSNRWDQEFILDPYFNLLSTKRVSQTPTR
jgi:hypothetical protein